MNESIDSSAVTTTKEKDNTHSSKQSGSNSPALPSSRTNDLPLVWKSLKNQGLSAAASNIITQSWRQGTVKQYRSYLQKWELYCRERKIDPIHPSVSDGVNFLSYLYESGVGYSAINTARSALSSIVMLPGNVSFGSHPLATRLLKGVFELRPSLPKYQDTWDVSVVLKVLEDWNLDDISLKDLSLKLTMLLAITTSQRIQTIKALSTNNMSLNENQCRFKFDVLLKTSQPGKHLNNLAVAAYSKSKNLCPIKHLQFLFGKDISFERDPYTTSRKLSETTQSCFH